VYKEDDVIDPSEANGKANDEIKEVEDNKASQVRKEIPVSADVPESYSAIEL